MQILILVKVAKVRDEKDIAIIPQHEIKRMRIAKYNSRDERNFIERFQQKFAQDTIYGC